MRVAVIGAGVVGITTAYFLHEKGCEVTVFEAENVPASQASNANGCQLSYSFTDAMADPALISKIAGILLRRDPAFRVIPNLDLDFLKWGLGFLRNCTQHQATANSHKLLRIALKSAGLMQHFHERFGEHYSHRKAGKLVLLRDNPTKQIKHRTYLKSKQGSDARIISIEEAREIEPALCHWASQPAAAIFSAKDEVGDSRKFAETLKKHLSKRGVRFKFGCPVSAIEVDKGRLSKLITKDSTESVEAVVVCAGTTSRALLRPLGIKVPIYPVSGYSVTLPLSSDSPRTSITALDKKIVLSRINGAIRIAGFADFNVSHKNHDKRIDHMVKLAREMAPRAADYAAKLQHRWTGYRPMTPNSLPIVGASKISGVYVNAGHGMLGWTLCAATGDAIAEKVLGT